MGPETITSQMSESDLSDGLAKSGMSHDDIQQCLAAHGSRANQMLRGALDADLLHMCLDLVMSDFL